MKVIVLYRPKSEHDTAINSFVSELKRRSPEAKLEMVSIDTVEGAEKARVYGVMQYPALLAISDDGTFQKMWEGTPLPLMSEVAYLAR